MKIGSLVKIYQLPATREDFEGVARVLKVVNDDMGTWEGVHFIRALVRFLDDGAMCERTIADGEVRR